MILQPSSFFFFFFNDTATTEIYTLSLHDALPISVFFSLPVVAQDTALKTRLAIDGQGKDRKSTRLNSSHGYISYAVFCLKKKKKNNNVEPTRQELTIDVNVRMSHALLWYTSLLLH